MSDTLHVSTRKGLFTLTRSAAGAWSVSDVAFVGVNCTLSCHDPRDGATYAALDHGHFGVKLHRRDAGGAWRELSAPAFASVQHAAPADDAPADAAPAAGGDSGSGQAAAASDEGAAEDAAAAAASGPSVQLLWSLTPGGADQPGTLWCGTVPGGLFRSDDRGESWSLNAALWARPERARWFGGGFDSAGIHSVCVDPRDSRRVAAGVSCGGLWLSEDGGASWEQRAQGMRAEFLPPEQAFDPEVQDPHLVVQCRGAPETWWTQHHNGIFRSTDDARSWHEVTDVRPSSFGFAVAVHPADPDTAWFVPAVKDEQRIPADAAVVVTRTRDGGRSFEVLRAGLPQSHAYDLVLRHALDVCGRGRRLAFGSTTGALWVSEDQGDHWTELSAHLPPIHAVRFA